MVAPPAGTLMGNADVVVKPAGSVPSVMVGVADVPVSAAVTVTKNASLAEIVSEEGLTMSDKVGVGGGTYVEPPPVPPPPQPAKAATSENMSQNCGAGFSIRSRHMNALLKDGLIKRLILRPV